MSKEEMIAWLLRAIESDRYAQPNLATEQATNQATEWSRLQALSYGEIEALYFKSEDLYALSA